MRLGIKEKVNPESYSNIPRRQCRLLIFVSQKFMLKIITVRKSRNKAILSPRANYKASGLSSRYLLYSQHQTKYRSGFKATLSYRRLPTQVTLRNALSLNLMSQDYGLLNFFTLLPLGHCLARTERLKKFLLNSTDETFCDRPQRTSLAISPRYKRFCYTNKIIC